MTKKDYELIARIFHKNITSNHPKETEVRFRATTISKAMAQQFADVLATNNPRFDRTKFLKACGIEESRRYNLDGSEQD